MTFHSREPSTELEHFGVKGMKWGKRKSGGSHGRIIRPGKSVTEFANLSRKERTAVIKESRTWLKGARKEYKGAKKAARQAHTEAGKAAAKAVVKEHKTLIKNDVRTLHAARIKTGTQYALLLASGGTAAPALMNRNATINVALNLQDRRKSKAAELAGG